jgi:hypothetical protein
MKIELSMAERRRTLQNSLQTNLSAENIITELMASPKGAGIDRIRADMEQIINEKSLREYQRVFTDRSLIENNVECAVVTTQTKIKVKLAEPTTIFIGILWVKNNRHRLC